MKAYLVTTSLVFVLLTVAHIARILVEDTRLALNPIFMAITLASAALSIWALLLIRRHPG